MKRTMHTFECTESQAALVAQFLAMNEELHHLALTAPNGTVLDACENQVVSQGRKLLAQELATAVAERIESAEKKGA